MSTRARPPAVSEATVRHWPPYEPLNDGLVTKARTKRFAICGQIKDGSA